MTEDGIAKRVEIAAPAELAPLIAEHGSIAVDGVSLTVSGLDGDEFEVSLIPETLERTTLGNLAAGDRVNLECDVVARYVQRLNDSMSTIKRGQMSTMAEAKTKSPSRRSKRRSRRSAPGAWSSSATTRTARTRATS